MAADVENFENDDHWLYGDNPDTTAPGTEDHVDNATPVQNNLTAPQPGPPGELFQDEGPPGVEKNDNFNEDNEAEDGELEQNTEDISDKDFDDDSDDDVNVVIGDIKTSAPLIKRGGLTTTIGDKSKAISQIGSKFNVEEFEQIGTINGVPATEFNLDVIEEKPWRKPGADITDYFNYGFNEDTWKAYCERQKRIRIHESGVGVVALNAIGLPARPMILMNDHSKYNNNFMGGMNHPRPMMQPPPIKPHEPPKMNTIQVMTADRREYSRKPNAFPDMTVPPPGAPFEEYQPEFAFNPEPEPFFDYEPTQDSQWAEGNPNWTPTDIKTLTGAPPMGPPPPVMGPPQAAVAGPPSSRSPSRRSPSREKDRERDRDRDRESSRSRSEKPRDREREKSRRRDRSRSKSRRHKSRSRSPGHRSHKKKKSKRHEDSD